ncbi:MAG: alpha-amylase family glycosyl hydrolase, partial [Thermomicrobiales bacterium]
PYVYQGEELGMTNMTFASIDEMNDIEAKNHFRLATAVEGADPDEVFARMAPRNRDNARTPMQWDASEGAGFTTGTPWLRVNPNHTAINAAAQVDDPDSVFAFYRAIIALRHEHPIVAHGDFTMLLPDDPAVYAFTRSLDGETWLVLGNFSRQDQTPALDAAWTGPDVERVIGNYADRAVGEAITLRAWELLVLRRASS